MKKIILAIVFMLVAQIGTAQNDYKQDVLKFIELSGISKTYENMVSEITKSIPAEKQADFKKELQASIKNLTSKMADLYAESFTHEEIKAILNFYESPVGKKMTATSTSDAFMQKAKSLGEEWGGELQGIMMKYME